MSEFDFDMMLCTGNYTTFASYSDLKNVTTF